MLLRGRRGRGRRMVELLVPAMWALSTLAALVEVIAPVRTWLPTLMPVLAVTLAGAVTTTIVGVVKRVTPPTLAAWELGRMDALGLGTRAIEPVRETRPALRLVGEGTGRYARSGHVDGHQR